jgi:hypothetical protein
LREIETSIRYLIRQKLPNQALKDALGSIRPKDASQPMELEALSFDELRSLILARWDYLQNVFVDRDKTDWQLLKIRDLRNAAFHFRTHLFASHLSQLRNFRDYYLTLASKTIT